ncbi:MAG: magnesium/cobalt transporter CorA [Candidatus Diapherotrites archaeon]|nr:magnesium/cobalt transporter CorA [Candidatus Micrarchaeota archaeon]MBU1939414.1 magnesium/cobalt transporter CorA [Candidatus Micrarchaeota archaeon]
MQIRPHSSRKKAGTSPGTVVYVGRKKTGTVKMKLIDYKGGSFTEKEIISAKECAEFASKPTVTWLDVTGVHDTEALSEIGKIFNTHHLILEDVANTTQRPKMEDYEKQLFIVLKMIQSSEKGRLSIEQVSIVLGPNYVLSFQEREGDVFEPVRERLRKGKGRMRNRGADYLAYTIMDAVIDNYFIILEAVGEKIETLEEEVMRSPSQKTLHQIHGLRRDLIFLRKSIWPLREVISRMQRDESSLIKGETGVYLRDLYDHTIQVIDNVESYRDMVSGMLDVYLSSISNRMNEVMKVLTIIATIFIPLTFLAGVYGMNFEFMPELKIWWAYPAVWAVMLSVAVLMFFYFRKKAWL